MTVGQTFRSLKENELCHVFIELLTPTNEAEQVTTGAELHHKAKMAVRVERVVQFNDIPMVGQVLEDLQVLRDLLLALHLLLHITLPHCLYCHKVSAELVLGDDHFAKGALS